MRPTGEYDVLERTAVGVHTVRLLGAEEGSYKLCSGHTTAGETEVCLTPVTPGASMSPHDTGQEGWNDPLL